MIWELLLTACLAASIGWCCHALAAAGRHTTHTHPAERALQDHIVLGWHDLQTACCLQAWATFGHAHDPATCTRKDPA